jgi:16S rRNA processing protein RimM
VVGRVRSLHGLRGQVRVEILTDRPGERFVAGGVVSLEGSDRRLTIASASPVADGPGWWLSFREIHSRTAAEALRDAYLEVVVDRAADLPAGRVYWHEVIGSEVRTRDGRPLGTVADVYRAGEAEVYVVRGGPAGELDLPAVQAFIAEFAPERGVIVVDERALDLDAAPVDARPPRERRPHRWSRHGKGGGDSTATATTPTAPEAATTEATETTETTETTKTTTTSGAAEGSDARS